MPLRVPKVDAAVGLPHPLADAVGSRVVHFDPSLPFFGPADPVRPRIVSTS
jgi:hypothetical protein